MSQHALRPPRGVLHPSVATAIAGLTRLAPSALLADYVEHYWSVRWSLPDHTTYTQRVLSHPSVHIVFEAAEARVFGVVTGRFTRVLHGSGSAFGIKFHPGMFRPLIATPVSDITDRVIPFGDLFGTGAITQARTSWDDISAEGHARAADAFLLQLIPPPHPPALQAREIVAHAREERNILRVEDLARRSGLSIRALQRLFGNYVGVSPKWVIQRYRLHEAAEQLAARPGTDWAQLAADLGYFDQAHFIKDFKAVVGATPAEYARDIAAPARQ